MEDIDIKAIESKANELLPSLKQELGEEECKEIPDEILLRFLRWKLDVKRAAQRFKDFQRWTKENPDLFDSSLRVSKDPELERLLKSEVIVAPPQARTFKNGPLIIGRLRNNDMKDGRTVNGVIRMFLYNIDRLLEDPECQLHGVTIVHDLRGFDRHKNIHLSIPKTLFGAIIGHFPVRIAAIYINDAPSWFPYFFVIISRIVMTKKIRERVNFLDSLDDLDEVMDKKLLLKEAGGELDFSIEDWVQEQKEREQSGNFSSLTDFVGK